MKTDIQSDSIFIERLPPYLRPFGILMRLDRPIGTWLLLLPCFWGAMLSDFRPLWQWSAEEWIACFYLFALFGIGAVALRGAGCVWNDIMDRKLDRGVERTAMRPIASGEVSVFKALLCIAVLLLVGFYILTKLPERVILIGCLAMLLVIPYPLMKRITWWPQLWLGFTFNWGVWIGWFIWQSEVSLAIVLLYGAGIFWTLGYDTIYALQDRVDDTKLGIKSTARLFGEVYLRWIAGFYFISWMLILAAIILRSGLSYGAIFMILPAVQFIWQIRKLHLEGVEKSLMLFKSNRDFGLLVTFALTVT